MTRNKKILAATGIAALLGGVAVAGIASAHDRGWGGGYHQGRMMHGEMGGGMRGGGMRQMLALADENKDGKVSREEIEKMRDAKFTQYDADKDGSLNLDEFQGLLMEMARPRTVRMFQHLDPNGDAAISKEEIDSRISMMIEHMDRNEDGVISKEDRPRRGQFRDGKRGYHHGMRDGRGPGWQMQDNDDDGTKKDGDSN